MAEIVIKRKLTLEFLGEEYKESYLTFRAVPLVEFEDFGQKLEGTEDSKALKEMLKFLKDHFTDGIFEGQKLEANDLEQFDAETIIRCFKKLRGDLDPKD